jgi:hypothetical protein
MHLPCEHPLDCNAISSTSLPHITLLQIQTTKKYHNWIHPIYSAHTSTPIQVRGNTDRRCHCVQFKHPVYPRHMGSYISTNHKQVHADAVDYSQQHVHLTGYLCQALPQGNVIPRSDCALLWTQRSYNININALILTIWGTGVQSFSLAFFHTNLIYKVSIIHIIFIYLVLNHY